MLGFTGMPKTDESLLRLIEATKGRAMTKAERDAQRKSWVVGEFMLAHPEVTRQYAEKVFFEVVGY